MLKLDIPIDPSLIEDTIVLYLWDKLDEECQQTILHEYYGGKWDALSSALMIADNYKIYIPEHLLKEAEEAAMEFIDISNGGYSDLILDPIIGIRENNAKLLAEGKIPA